MAGIYQLLLSGQTTSAGRDLQDHLLQLPESFRAAQELKHILRDSPKAFETLTVFDHLPGSLSQCLTTLF